MSDLTEPTKCVIVDIETTGLESARDKIIEIGLIEFEHSHYQNPSIIRMYSGIEDPGTALDPEITKITGLTDALVKNKKIDWTIVQEFISNSSLVIAHNASFDRGFLNEVKVLEGRFPRWACSLKHIDWLKHGLKSRSLNYLACDLGFINPFAHRALFDCATTFRVISPFLQELSENCLLKEFKISAVGAPYDTKDILKSRGYRWDQQKKTWFTFVLENALANERQFLAGEIYRGQSKHLEEAN